MTAAVAVWCVAAATVIVTGAEYLQSRKAKRHLREHTRYIVDQQTRKLAHRTKETQR